MSVYTIISWCLVGISLIMTVLSFIATYRKASKDKLKTALQALIPNLIITAETLHGAKQGVAKKDYVMTQAKLFALENGLKFESDTISNYVDNIVECTNNVNTDKPTKTPKDDNVGESATTSTNCTQNITNII